jgi:hypothetical protein
VALPSADTLSTVACGETWGTASCAEAIAGTVDAASAREARNEVFIQ